MKVGTVEVLDNGFIFTTPDGITHGCGSPLSLAEILGKLMFEQMLYKRSKGERYIIELNKVAPR